MSSTSSRSDDRDPIIVGIYGISGAGKSFILQQLKEKIKHFIFYEGSEMIDKVCPGGLSQFQQLEESKKIRYRALAIRKIQEISMNKGASALVAGHYSVWSEELSEPQSIWTEDDMAVYTHILYIDTLPEVIKQHSSEDEGKKRVDLSIEALKAWKKFEKDELKKVCDENRIFYVELPTRLQSPSSLVQIICNLEMQTEEENAERAKSYLGKILRKSPNRVEKVLLLDCDKTIAPQDSGRLFWQNIHLEAHSPSADGYTPFERIFASKWKYSYAAFRKAMFVCEKWADEQTFEKTCEDTARSIELYPEIVELLTQATSTRHIKVILITCGIRRIWDHVIDKYGFPRKIEVIGGGRFNDGYVVTPRIKGQLVVALQERYGAYVCAFGDSPLDSKMLSKANQAIVVAGLELTRSRSMEGELVKLLDVPEFLPQQVILPADGKPFLDEQRIPIISLSHYGVIESLLSPCIPVAHATQKNAAKLLATPTRDKSVSGPQLQEAHKAIGRYLATEYISDIVGVDEGYPIQHVQGHWLGGHGLMKEDKTLIVAVMRSGEPLATGIYETFPRAIFLHANQPDDIKRDDLKEIYTILLVDYVINSGNTISQFVHRIRSLDENVPIVVVAGVIHRATVAASQFSGDMSRIRSIDFVALRLSNNRYKGKGVLDSGHRLFGRG